MRVVDGMAAGCFWGMAATDAAGNSCCYVFASLRNETSGVMLEIRGNMGQCKSEDRQVKRD
jgi:hypothetical protein